MLAAANTGTYGITAWETASWKEVYQVAGHSDTVNSLAWSPDSRILAGVKTLWLADGTVFSTSNSQSGYVNSVAWSPDGKMLATGGSDNIVHLWTPDGKSLDLLQGHTGVIEVVAWSPNGNILASGSDDATIRLWTFK
jgi:WD40 repeat protein